MFNLIEFLERFEKYNKGIPATSRLITLPVMPGVVCLITVSFS